MSNSKKNFIRQHSILKKIGKSWRKPRGIHSKIRLSKAGHPVLPRVGYGKKKQQKFLIKDKIPIKVNNLNDIKKISEGNIIIISGKLGLRKKIQVLEAINKSNLPIFKIDDVKTYLESLKQKFEDTRKNKQKRLQQASKKEEKKEEGKEVPLSLEAKKDQESEIKKKVLEGKRNDY